MAGVRDPSTGTSRSRGRALTAVLGCAATAALAGCGGSATTSSSTASPSIPKINITAGPNGFEPLPTTPFPAGLIEFDLHNTDVAPHSFNFATPLAGVTLDQFRTSLQNVGPNSQQPPPVEFSLAWVLPPEQSQTLYLNYNASTNFVASMLSRGPSAPPDAARGYLVQFTVRGTPPIGAASLSPKVTGTLSINASSFTVPSGFGKGTFSINNTDMVGHGVNVIGVTDASKTLADIIAGLDVGPQSPGPPPLWLKQMGGALTIPSPGCSCVVSSVILATYDLHPGRYVVADLQMDPKTNKSRFTEGLIAEFTVS